MKHNLHIWFKENDKELFEESIPKAFKRFLVVNPDKVPVNFREEDGNVYRDIDYDGIISCILEESGYMAEVEDKFNLGKIRSTHIKINKLLPDYPKGVILVYPDSFKSPDDGKRKVIEMDDFTGYTTRSWSELFKNRVYNTFENYEKLVEESDENYKPLALYGVEKDAPKCEFFSI